MEELLFVVSGYSLKYLSKYIKNDKKGSLEIFKITRILIKDEINDTDQDKESLKKEYVEILNLTKVFLRDLEGNFNKIPHQVVYIFLKLRK